MTSPETSPEDAAIAAAVAALLADRDESVSDLAYHTRISAASIYRKLNNQAAWKAADIGAVARHFRVQPGDLFLGSRVLGPARRDPASISRGRKVSTRGYSPAARRPTSTNAVTCVGSFRAA